MSQPLKVLVVDTLSDEVLFECSIEELESAYQRAAEYEEMGLDVKVVAPSVTQTLTNSLGMTHEEEEEYQNSVVAEMEDHEGSCCVSPEQMHEGDPDNVQ